MKTAKCAVELKDKGVCGVDIAGDESRFPLKDFEKPIELCKNSGVNITIHAGEASGPEKIKEAVDMGADRIGHGVTLQQDEILMKEIADNMLDISKRDEISVTAITKLSGIKSILKSKEVRKSKISKLLLEKTSLKRTVEAKQQ